MTVAPLCPTDSEVALPDLLRRYKTRPVVARGERLLVFRGVDPELLVPVAVKVFRLDKTDDDERAKSRFLASRER